MLRPALRLPTGWPLYVLFAGYPVTWFLGLSQFVWPLVAFPLLLALLHRKVVRAPRGFGLWLGFLACVVASVVMLDEAGRLVLFGYRASLYVSATILFLVVYNAPRDLLPSTKVARLIAIFGAIVIVGGLLGVLLPGAEFHTPAESVLPQRLLADEWIHDLVHVNFTEENFLETGRPRPSAPFSYTNGWGANFALTAPFVASMALWGSRRRALWATITVASVIPLIFTLNRGAWLALVLTVAYALVKFLAAGRPAAVAAVVVASGIVSAIVIVTPLDEVLVDRLANPHSNTGRIALYEESVDNALDSPILGFGTTRPSTQRWTPAQGTHGQIWLVLFSHGVPAAAFFLGWFGVTLWATRRSATWPGFVAHLTIFVGIIIIWYYGLLASGLQVLMVAAAVAWREQLLVVDDSSSATTDSPPPLVGPESR